MILSDITSLSKGSHTKIRIKCDYNISEKCRKEFLRPYKDYLRYKNNTEQDICLYCSRALKFSGRNNPNCKYQFDDKFMISIDSNEKAYLLGWLASDGHLSKNGVAVIKIDSKDVDILHQLKDIICSELQITNESTKVCLNICSTQIVEDCCRHLNIRPGKKSDIVEFPNLENDELKWSFIRGYFDGDGGITTEDAKQRYPECSIYSNSKSILNSIKDIVNTPGEVSENRIGWSGNNCLDVLGKLYDNQNLYLKRKKDQYIMWSSWVKSLSGKKSAFNDNKIKINKCKPNAILPSKNRISDSGYDVYIIDEINRDGDVIFYGTGIKVTPPIGYYFDMVPRSSISKTGYISANSTGIIDRTYIGELIVPLIKINKNKPDLELPYKICQLIPRPIEHFEIEQCESLENTNRDDKGFGSSGN